MLQTGKDSVNISCTEDSNGEIVFDFSCAKDRKIMECISMDIQLVLSRNCSINNIGPDC